VKEEGAPYVFGGGSEDAKHMLLKCPEIKKWREFICSKRLNINENTVYRKIISSTHVTKMKTIQKYLFKTTCKWESNLGGTQAPSPQS
jgi:hypothetical protein